MKKVILIAFMAIFSCGVFAAEIHDDVKVTIVLKDNISKSDLKFDNQNKIAEKKQKGCYDNFDIVSSCGITAHC